MHNHLKRLGLFISHTIPQQNDENKRVKTLYKNDKNYKMNSKSSNEEDDPTKHRKHRQKHHKHHRVDASSQTELVYMTPEDLKKYYKTLRRRKKYEENENNNKRDKREKTCAGEHYYNYDKYFVIEKTESIEKPKKNRSRSVPATHPSDSEPGKKRKHTKDKSSKRSRSNYNSRDVYDKETKNYRRDMEQMREKLAHIESVDYVKKTKKNNPSEEMIKRRSKRQEEIATDSKTDSKTDSTPPPIKIPDKTKKKKPKIILNKSSSSEDIKFTGIKNTCSYAQNFPSKTNCEITQPKSIKNEKRNMKSVSMNVPSTISKINSFLEHPKTFLNYGKKSSTELLNNSDLFSFVEKDNSSGIFREFPSFTEYKAILKAAKRKNDLDVSCFCIVNISSTKYKKSNNGEDVEEKIRKRHFLKYYGDSCTNIHSFSDCHKNYDGSGSILDESPRKIKELKTETHAVQIKPEKPKLIREKSKIPILNRNKSNILFGEKKIKKEKVKNDVYLPPIKEKSSSIKKMSDSGKSLQKQESILKSSMKKNNIEKSQCKKVETVKLKNKKFQVVEKQEKLSVPKKEVVEKPKKDVQKLITKKEIKEKAIVMKKPEVKIKKSSVVKEISSPSNKSTNKSSFGSHSDTKITTKTKQQKKNIINNSNNIKKQPQSLKSSLSNSTFGDRSQDSGKTQTSFLLTKIYKDEDKWNRWQKRKEYADLIRKNVINRAQQKHQKINQVVGVHYVTVENLPNNNNNIINETNKEIEKKTNNNNNNDIDDFDNCFKYRPEFEELIAPIEEDLHNIINENTSFLEKDFTASFTKPSISSLDTDKWIENDDDDESVSTDDLKESTCADDNVGDLPSMSEESGYSTIKSSSFFQRPSIKALMQIPPPVSIEPIILLPPLPLQQSSSSNNIFSRFSDTSSTSNKTSGVEICSIESIGLQTDKINSEKSLQFVTNINRIEENERNKNCGRILEAVQVNTIDISPRKNDNKECRSKLWLKKFCKTKLNCITVKNDE